MEHNLFSVIRPSLRMQREKPMENQSGFQNESAQKQTAALITEKKRMIFTIVGRIMTLKYIWHYICTYVSICDQCETLGPEPQERSRASEGAARAVHRKCKSKQNTNRENVDGIQSSDK